VILVGLIFAVALKTFPVLAEGAALSPSTSDNFITIYDSGTKLTIRTDAPTVADVLERANISITDFDTIEPALDTPTESAPNFIINIYRAHFVIVVDGVERKKVLTAASDPASVARAAGLTIYDGDEIKISTSPAFLETGIPVEYRVARSGGNTITLEEEIPFSTRTLYDANSPKGQQRTETIGELGRKTLVYKVDFLDGVEAKRTLTSETITVEPVDHVIIIGTKLALPSGSHEDWMRAAGISESDFGFVNFIVQKESGWTFHSRNKSSGAYGLCQALPGNKMASAGADWETNPTTQLKWCASYAKGRYGSWENAYNFWLLKHWW
jgi:uncharacterized protein YabE (DUF348 family)